MQLPRNTTLQVRTVPDQQLNGVVKHAPFVHTVSASMFRFVPPVSPTAKDQSRQNKSSQHPALPSRLRLRRRMSRMSHIVSPFLNHISIWEFIIMGPWNQLLACRYRSRTRQSKSPPAAAFSRSGCWAKIRKFGCGEIWRDWRSSSKQICVERWSSPVSIGRRSANRWPEIGIHASYNISNLRKMFWCRTLRSCLNSVNIELTNTLIGHSRFLAEEQPHVVRCERLNQAAGSA